MVGFSLARTAPLVLALSVALSFGCGSDPEPEIRGTGGDGGSGGTAGSGGTGGIVYFKASDTDAEDLFGFAVSLSTDGDTLAVGARHEDSGATGVNGNQTDESAWRAGAVYVFTRSGNTWSQQAYVKASNTDAQDDFGYALSLSADGNTLAVGALIEMSSATGVNGDQTDNSAPIAGAVYVFTRSGSTWSQQAYVKASNTGGDDHFGSTVSLSADGNTLAVGSPFEDSGATGVDGDAADNSLESAGAVYVFVRSGSTWSQQAYVKASNTDRDDLYNSGHNFGRAVSLSGDGQTLAVGASSEASGAIGVDGDQADNSFIYAGAVYVFTRSGSTWSQQAYVKASNTDGGDYFGWSVSVSKDGDTLAVGAIGEGSSATGVDGNQGNNSLESAGAVYAFVRSGSAWSQQAYLKASRTREGHRFGEAVSVSAEGSTLAVGSAAGVVDVFSRSGSTWSQQAYVEASNTDGGDGFGYALSFSGSGNTLAVGAGNEDSGATGINGDQSDNSAENSGAVYVYELE